jgi:23S rRNA pseudouridine955/2504/2580 synthase
LEDIKQRLDRFIRRKYGKNILQSAIEIAIRNKSILVNGKKTSTCELVSCDDEIFVAPGTLEKFSTFKTEPSKMKPGINEFRESINLHELKYANELNAEHADKVKQNHEIKRILKLAKHFQSMIIYEDEDHIIANKPSGLPVQGGTKVRNSLDLIAVAYCKEARLVHRIDRDASGITIFAKNIKTARYMLELFRNKEVRKEYIALTLGIPKPTQGKIVAPIIRTNLGSFIDNNSGKEAITRYSLEKILHNNTCILRVFPETGRTHQIRVHLAQHLKTPIIGDKKYGKTAGLLHSQPLCLHSHKVSFFTITGDLINVDAELPEHIDLHRI